MMIHALGNVRAVCRTNLEYTSDGVTVDDYCLGVNRVIDIRAGYTSTVDG